jgi:hypothetical protein
MHLTDLAPGEHVLRIRVPGCEITDVHIVVDPASDESVVRVTLAAAESDSDSPFVYDLY